MASEHQRRVGQAREDQSRRPEAAPAHSKATKEQEQEDSPRSFQDSHRFLIINLISKEQSYGLMEILNDGRHDDVDGDDVDRRGHRPAIDVCMTSAAPGYLISFYLNFSSARHCFYTTFPSPIPPSHSSPPLSLLCSSFPYSTHSKNIYIHLFEKKNKYTYINVCFIYISFLSFPFLFFSLWSGPASWPGELGLLAIDFLHLRRAPKGTSLPASAADWLVETTGAPMIPLPPPPPPPPPHPYTHLHTLTHTHDKNQFHISITP